MMKLLRNSLLLFIIAFVAFSCKHKMKQTGTNASFEVQDFMTLTNWNALIISGQKHLYLDYVNAIKGFSIPSVRQTKDGYFNFTFSVKNISGKPQKFWYKIYYQNESYKFPEVSANGKSEHPYAAENFYGSWDDTTATFLSTPEIPADNQFHQVKAKLRITGNPRNEKRYYINNINERWTRNPRVGNYRFMLVVCTEEMIRSNAIPDYISNISLKHEGKFVNPFFYFLYGNGQKLPDVFVKAGNNDLCVIAKPDLKAGVYSIPQDFDPKTYSSFYTKTCNSGEDLFHNAPLMQYLNAVPASSKMDNIPVIADVLNDNYSLRDYNWNRTFHKKEELITITPQLIDCPCSNSDVDSATGDVVIRNKAAIWGDWRKQSVAVITRHGLTYGKYTMKVKLSELLNKNDVWNGITNAIWLVTQSAGDAWNNCRECTKEGYLPKYWGGSLDERSPLTAYSEIDFEILKTVNTCPPWQFPPVSIYPLPDRSHISWWDVPLPQNVAADTGKVMVCCTNWDMACPKPAHYDVGCRSVSCGNQTFMAHRWDYWYRALTERAPESDDELFKAPYYYFQIEWKPTEIVWRIGPEKDKLRVVGYMNDEVTSIPNNQMLLIISQEFHNTDWWRGSPYEQQFIPFPKNDLIGRIMEITVE
jgi:hypothetical protein